MKDFVRFHPQHLAVPRILFYDKVKYQESLNVFRAPPMLNFYYWHSPHVWQQNRRRMILCP